MALKGLAESAGAMKELDRAEALLGQARHASGLAAYQYFFVDSDPVAREAYLAALEAEAEAELLLAALRHENP